MDYFAKGSPATIIDDNQASQLIRKMLEQMGTLRRVLLIPPDYTRLHSGAGELTCMLYRQLHQTAHVEVLPALGTHSPMTQLQRQTMFPGIPDTAFLEHDWRNGLINLGEVPASFINEITQGKADFPIRCEINRTLIEGKWDRIISIGQLVPHEVAGIANQSKNIFVGAGGQDTINRTHYVSALYGIENTMGRPDTPVRATFDYMAEHFTPDLPITYLLTVRSRHETGVVTNGLFAGDTRELFLEGAALSQQINIELLDKPIRKAVVFLDPDEYHSTWLGNKAIYRLRMAIADGGELIILAPGVNTFGEDPQIDHLIRTFGYSGADILRALVAENDQLSDNLSAAAHLIHGSTENRFNVTYCTSQLTKEEIESVGFNHEDCETMLSRYNPDALQDGWNMLPDEEIVYVSNPGLGLWSLRDRFNEAAT